MPIGVYPRPTAKARFWAKLDKTESGCWEWVGNILQSGYGQIAITHTHMELAHRFAYELLVGPIPEGLQLDHLCRVRHCVNPDHLEPVTARENVLRGNGIAAQSARQTHCIHGHPFDEGNTYLTKRGWRQCRTCTKLRKAKELPSYRTGEIQN